MEVRVAGDADEVEQALALRERVFCGEQGVQLVAERDGRDDEALHLVALEDGRVVGTCRVLLDRQLARLGRMAVEPGLRRRGIGAALLVEAERAAGAAGAHTMALHAQLSVRDLYARGGYVERGEVFVEEGIDHVTMEHRLA
jgi:predicted GNAT family N-acyltransferase